VNPCSRTAPCKTFAGAISKTATGGIINALDSAGFGTLTITKAITVDATPFMGGMLAGGVAGVIVNAGTADVFLRGLDIEGTGGGTRGIRILAAGRVEIDRCRIAQFTQRGISVETSAAVSVTVNNTLVHGNTGDGIVFQPSAGTPTNRGEIKDSVIDNNTGNGIFVQSARVHVTDSVVGMNGTGARADATTGVAVLSFIRSTVTQNANGLISQNGANAFIRLEQMTLEDNLTSGFQVLGGSQIFSYKDNYIEGNGANTGLLTNVSVDKQ